MFCSDFVQVAEDWITARSTSTGYDAINTMVLDELPRRHRAADVTKSDILPLYVINFGAAQALAGIFLNDVNFDEVQLFGHASDLSTDWSTASYKSGDVTISKNKHTQRYSLYNALGGSFNYQYLAISPSAGCTAVGDYTSYWECGMIACLESVTTLAKNMSFGYQREGAQAIRETALYFGGKSRTSPSRTRKIQWKGTINFEHRTEAEEAELWTLNSWEAHAPIFFYENRSNTQDGYLCFVDNFYRGVLLHTNGTTGLVRGSTIELSEVK